MATFNYTAQKDGKVVSGTLSATNREAALTSLAKQSLKPILVREDGGKKGFTLNMQLGAPKVKVADRVIFTRQLATLINAGVPLSRSLHTLTEQTESKGLKHYLPIVTRQVEGGISLADAMAEHPKVFNSIYVNMVRAGETGGILDDILNRLALQQEKDAEMRGKLKSALTYPMVILSITVVAFLYLMTSIVPKIGNIIRDLAGDNYKPPIYTTIMLHISGFLVHYGVYILIVTVGGGFFAWRYLHSKKGRPLLDNALLHMPVLGKVVKKVALARFARTFSALSAAGVSVLDTLQVTGEAIGNVIISRQLEHAAVEVKNGKPLSEPLSQSKLFPPIVSQMIAVGEETGEIDKLLVKLADFYEEEVNRVADSLTSIIEPIMIVILGSIIGVIALSVYGPIASVTQNIH